MPISKKRKAEILRLAQQGGDELTIAIEAGDYAYHRHMRKINREINDFVTKCADKYELDYFAEEWPRDGNVKPILKLVQNKHTDAGTLLWNYWNASVEDYYLFNRYASELEPGIERDVFTILLRCERRIVNSEYRNAAIPFDPTPRISMQERHAEFARQIPPQMFKPILGRNRKREKQREKQRAQPERRIGRVLKSKSNSLGRLGHYLAKTRTSNGVTS